MGMILILKVDFKYFLLKFYWISSTPKVDSNVQLNSEHGIKEVIR